MSLRVDWSKTEAKNKIDPEDMQVEAHCIGMLAALVGIGTITEQNWEEFYVRAAAWQKAFGAFLIRKGNPYNYTPDDIKDWIGLSVNVVPATKIRFRNHLANTMIKEAEQSLRRYKKETQSA